MDYNSLKIIFPESEEKLLKEYCRHIPEKENSWQTMNTAWLFAECCGRITEFIKAHGQIDDTIDLILLLRMYLERELKMARGEDE